MTSNALLGYNTLMDVVNSYGSQDAMASYLAVAEVLNRACPMLKALPMIPSNQIMSNIGSKRSYLAAPGTRRFNYGVSPSANHKTPYTDQIAIIEDYSEVDKALWAIQNDPNAWRNDEDAAKSEAMSQKAEDLIIYGSIATDPAAFDGLATRFASLTKRPNGDSLRPYNVVSGGGSGSTLSSIWVIEPGKNKVFLTYPKNLPGGLQVNDLGEATANIGTGTAPKYLQVLRTHLVWNLGLVVSDDRCVQRYCNIATSGISNLFDDDILLKLINHLPGKGMSPGTFVAVSTSIKDYIDIRGKDKTNVQYGPDNIFGENTTKFRGVPVIVAEMLDDTESAVS